jgi:hypothetical protein
MKDLVKFTLIIATAGAGLAYCMHRPTLEEERQFQAYKTQRAIDRYEDALSETQTARRRAEMEYRELERSETAGKP